MKGILTQLYPDNQNASSAIPSEPLLLVNIAVTQALKISVSKELKAPLSEKYNGLSSKLSKFLTALDVSFTMQPSTYSLETNKIYYTTSLLTNNSQCWWDANRTKIDSLISILPEWQSYEDFK